MVMIHPIVIVSCDSRFEYGLSRDPENPIFETTWWKALRKQPISGKQKNKSLEKT
jgi:hypothetical protein